MWRNPFWGHLLNDHNGSVCSSSCVDFCAAVVDLRKEDDILSAVNVISAVNASDVLSSHDSSNHGILQVKGVELQLPLPSMTYADAMLRYGTDRPDTRFGFQLADVSDAVAGCAFR